MKEPRIEYLDKIQLIGLSIETSLVENKTYELWRNFKMTLKEIDELEAKTFYSVQKYSPDFPKAFSPSSKFRKWASIENIQKKEIPKTFDTIEIGGLFAVFIHKGTTATFHLTTQYIFGVWLPSSTYELENNYHFELMDSKYDPNDPETSEEVWIPVKLKT